MTGAPPPVAPLAAPPVDPADWPEGWRGPMRAALWWARAMPRGKGWVPRWVGRHWCAGRRSSLRTRGGARLAIDPSCLDVYTTIATHGNAWDAHVVDACLALLDPGDVFYDVGASVGYITLEAARRVGAQGQVVAFEPQPSLAHHIAVSAALNGMRAVTVYPAMLGREAGPGVLHVGSHSVHASAIAREPDAAAIACERTTLDALVASGAIRPPNVIKVDVEGAELQVFEGARRTLARFRPALVFESDANMDRYGYRRAELLALLGTCAEYRFYFLTETGERLPVGREAIEDRRHADLLALPPGAA